MSDEKKKFNLLHVIIGLLILLLAVQTAAVVHLMTKKEPKQTAAAFEPQHYAKRAAQPSWYPRQGGISSPYAGQASFWDDPFFEDAFSALGRISQRMNRAFNELSAGNFIPTVDLQETEDMYIVRSDVPGLAKDKIDVTVRDGLLTIQGVRESGSETKDEETGYYSQERQYGSFARTIPLPGPVDEGNITADYKNGVLTVKLPKASEEDVQPNKIQVQ